MNLFTKTIYNFLDVVHEILLLSNPNIQEILHVGVHL